MNDSHVAQAEVVVGERRDRLSLVKVVVGRAVIACMVLGSRIAPQVRCQRRRRIRSRDQNQPRLAQNRRRLHCRRRTRSADYPHYAPVAHNRARRRRAALRRTQRIQSRPHRHRAPLDRAVVGQRQRHRPLCRRSKFAYARKHRRRTDMNLLTRTHHNRSQRAHHHILRDARAAQQERKQQNRPAQKSTAGAVYFRHLFTPWSEILFGMSRSRRITINNRQTFNLGHRRISVV